MIIITSLQNKTKPNNGVCFGWIEVFKCNDGCTYVYGNMGENVFALTST